jgi:hypothetical protein
MAYEFDIMCGQAFSTSDPFANALKPRKRNKLLDEMKETYEGIIEKYKAETIDSFAGIGVKVENDNLEESSEKVGKIVKEIGDWYNSTYNQEHKFEYRLRK